MPEMQLPFTWIDTPSIRRLEPALRSICTPYRQAGPGGIVGVLCDAIATDSIDPRAPTTFLMLGEDLRIVQRDWFSLDEATRRRIAMPAMDVSAILTATRPLSEIAAPLRRTDDPTFDLEIVLTATSALLTNSDFLDGRICEKPEDAYRPTDQDEIDSLLLMAGFGTSLSSHERLTRLAALADDAALFVRLRRLAGPDGSPVALAFPAFR